MLFFGEENSPFFTISTSLPTPEKGSVEMFLLCKHVSISLKFTSGIKPRHRVNCIGLIVTIFCKNKYLALISEKLEDSYFPCDSLFLFLCFSFAIVYIPRSKVLLASVTVPLWQNITQAFNKFNLLFCFNSFFKL